MKKVILALVICVFVLNIFSAHAGSIDDFVNVAASQVDTSYSMDPNRDYYIYDELMYGQWFIEDREWYQNLYNSSYYLHECPWCVIFVSWCSARAGMSIPKYSDVTEMKNWFASNGCYHDWQSYNPKRGDVVFFMRDGRDSHVAIVEAAEVLPDTPYKDEKRIKLTIIEGDYIYSGDGWKCCNVKRSSLEIRTSNQTNNSIFQSHNVVVGFGEVW